MCDLAARDALEYPGTPRYMPVRYSSDHVLRKEVTHAPDVLVATTTW